jgi:hypothetical protein
MLYAAGITGLVTMLLSLTQVAFLPAMMIGLVFAAVAASAASLFSGGKRELPNDHRTPTVPSWSTETVPIPSNKGTTDASSAAASTVEIKQRLEKVKKIRIPATDLKYLAEIIEGAERGDANSYWRLGAAYDRGKVVMNEVFPKDKDAAKFWYHQSAELGDVSSQHHLGLMYLGELVSELGLPYSDDNVVKQNKSEAVKWLGKAAEQSDDVFAPGAQDILGEMYFSGIGVPRDHAKAFEMFSKVNDNRTSMTRRFGMETRADKRMPELAAAGYTKDAPLSENRT